jgi:hypothetical protein
MVHALKLLFSSLLNDFEIRARWLPRLSRCLIGDRLASGASPELWELSDGLLECI